MRGRLLRIAAVLLILLSLIALSGCAKRGKTGKGASGEEQPSGGGSGDAAAQDVQTEGSPGRMTENTEQGGVDIVVTAEDGGEAVYTFTDVALDSWYARAAAYVVSSGLMTGAEGTDAFQPDYGVPRETFALILYRFAGGEPVEPRTRFSDVPPDSWFYDAVSWVTNQRFMNGTEPTVFGAGQFMTCEQTIIALYRLAGEPKTEGSLTDYPYAAKVSESGWNAVSWAWESGLINESVCVWYPTQAISRAQLAYLLLQCSTMAKAEK